MLRGSSRSDLARADFDSVTQLKSVRSWGKFMAPLSLPASLMQHSVRPAFSHSTVAVVLLLVIAVFSNPAAAVPVMQHAGGRATFDVRRHLGSKTRYAFRLPVDNAPSIYATPDPVGYEPVHLYLLARHGSRWPTQARMAQINSLSWLFKDVGNQKDHPWTKDWRSPFANMTRKEGELHPIGEDELWGLGYRLRQRFPTLLHRQYLPRTYPIVSTQVARTAASASAFAGGFFPSVPARAELEPIDLPTLGQGWNLQEASAASGGDSGISGAGSSGLSADSGSGWGRVSRGVASEAGVGKVSSGGSSSGGSSGGSSSSGGGMGGRRLRSSGKGSMFAAGTAGDLSGRASSSHNSAAGGSSSIGMLRPQAVAMTMAPKDNDPLLRFFDMCPRYAQRDAFTERWLSGWMLKQWAGVAASLESRLGLKRNLDPCEVEALWQLCLMEATLYGSTDRACTLFTPSEHLWLEYLDDVHLLETQSYGADINFHIAAPLLQDLNDTLTMAAHDASLSPSAIVFEDEYAAMDDSRSGSSNIGSSGGLYSSSSSSSADSGSSSSSMLRDDDGRSGQADNGMSKGSNGADAAAALADTFLGHRPGDHSHRHHHHRGKDRGVPARLLFAHCETIVPVATLLGLFEPNLPRTGEASAQEMMEAEHVSPRIALKQLVELDSIEDLGTLFTRQTIPLNSLEEATLSNGSTVSEDPAAVANNGHKRVKTGMPGMATAGNSAKDVSIDNSGRSSNTSSGSSTAAAEAVSAGGSNAGAVTGSGNGTAKQKSQRKRVLTELRDESSPCYDGGGGSHPLPPPPEGWRPMIVNEESRVFKASRIASFGANIAFVLYRRKGATSGREEDHVVRLLYNEQILQVPGCSSDTLECPLPEFLALLRRKTRKESLDQMCFRSDDEQASSSSSVRSSKSKKSDIASW